MYRTMKVMSVLFLMAFSLPSSWAADQQRDQTQDKTQTQDQTQDRDDTRDQDRIRDRDRLQDRDQVREQDRDRLQDRDRVQDRERIYGYDLMTPQEREEHRAKMRSLKTEKEREAFRREHHEKMQARARERGIQLPDTPPERGRAHRMDGRPGPRR